jgi:hypothetical protein
MPTFGRFGLSSSRKSITLLSITGPTNWQMSWINFKIDAMKKGKPNDFTMLENRLGLPVTSSTQTHFVSFVFSQFLSMLS